MVDLESQDTDWVGEREKEVLDAILLRDGLLLTILRVDKGNCGCIGCVSCGFGALREAPRVTDG